MKTFMWILVLSTLVTACTSTKPLTETEQKELEAWGTETPFEIISNRALPMPTAAFSALANSGMLAPGNSASSIDLTTNSNFFKMKGDTISAQLPYFGERRFGGNYGSNDISIRFNGIPTRRNIALNSGKRRMEMRFRISQEDDNEVYDILVMIFPNKTTRIDVTSSERTPISYNGRIEALE
ncbi:MAG: DUF4251 domain-containing protein [Flavobacteriaceae bacterium]|nr:DUF4251 domain-containing protein [Flavobacteriaceae bacterium]